MATALAALALAVAVANLALFIYLARAHNQAHREVGQLFGHVFSIRNDMAERLDELKSEMGKLAASGVAAMPARFSPTMKISEILATHSGAEAVLKTHGLEGCTGCASSQAETLEQAVKKYAASLVALLQELNALPAHDPVAKPADATAAKKEDAGVIPSSSIPFLTS